MKKILAVLIALSLCGAAFYAVAGSGRESTGLPPQEVRVMYTSEDYGYALKNISGTVQWRVLPNGGMTFFDSSGNTIYTISTSLGVGPESQSIGYLGGTTATIAWTVQSAAGVSPSLTTQAGNSGWFLTATHLAKYKSFYIDPSGGTAGASPYTKACPVGIASTGATIYLANSLLTSAVHGKVWTFTNLTGTTPFVLYAPNGRINGGSGTTETPTGTTARAPDAAGDTVEIQAIFTPTTVSGWYVRNVYNY